MIIHNSHPISAIEDAASVFYRRRAKIMRSADIADMTTEPWRTRLQQKIDEANVSYRSLSLSAGLGHGYVHSIMKDGKDPSVDRLSRICDKLNTSVHWVLYGIEISAEDLEILKMIQENPDRRSALIALLGIK